MHYIEFPFPFDNRLTSQDILRTRREQLKLTQQQVATGAHLQLRQYQRIESGERNLETATLKTALSICAVLKLDPFTFLPEGELMNKYYELNTKGNNTWATEELLTLLISQACDIYNEEFGTNYSLDNIKIAFCTLDNIVDVYRGFTAEYGFHSEMKVLSDFESELAEAFIGQTDIDDPNHIDGILLRLDPPKEFSDQKYYQLVIVHELAHIFCTTHELESAGKSGQRFYDLYCEGKEGSPAEQFNNGFISAGYAILNIALRLNTHGR
ncbi:MAG: helix-turn-helix transcriptional regulator [Ruminococcus sp.]|uniref:helix-turn-helix domain-containing protein n=1 Tax=Ruminococcus sp. TaxID=41978 RepID=UPI0025F03249|nr:helix-turn-helix transcriptional regulator [Ruminococcus sp.]MBR5684113.1 helix-turn-helix transcriptional regulator [Ruminococcus sp.]